MSPEAGGCSRHDIIGCEVCFGPEQQDSSSFPSPDYVEFSCAHCGEGLRMMPHGDPGALKGVCKTHGSMVFIHFPAGVPVSSMAPDGTFVTTQRSE